MTIYASKTLSACIFTLSLFCPPIRIYAEPPPTRIQCPDGDHINIDLKQLTIRYDASSFAGTLSSLGVLSGRLEIAPTKLQEASVATQQWNEFLKGLVAGYNSCAITRQQYAEGVMQIYPRLKSDAAELETIRKRIAAGQKADEKRIGSLVDSYYDKLRQFAHVSGQDVLLQQINALAEQYARGQEKLTVGQQNIVEQQKTDTQQILERLNQLQQSISTNPIPSAGEVKQQISEVRKRLLAKADDAEAAYNEGYDLFNRFRFADSITAFKRALSDVPLPVFYVALGRAYMALPDVGLAEKTIRDGFQLLRGDDDRPYEAQLSVQLSIILLGKGDSAGALTYADRALSISKEVYGEKNVNTVIGYNILGQVLFDKADLHGAYETMKKALDTSKQILSSDDPIVIGLNNNVGQILKAQGDWESALSYTEDALVAASRLYGDSSPLIATYSINVGSILIDKGDPKRALPYLMKALNIDERAYGPDHPEVATDCSNIIPVLFSRHDSAAALQYALRALRIDEKAYGSEHPRVALDYDNLGEAYAESGKLDAAIEYARKALGLYERIYGADSIKVVKPATNLGMDLKRKGDFDGAFTYVLRALSIDEHVYGSGHPEVARDCANLGEILIAKKNLKGALRYYKRALEIDETGVHGENDPRVVTDLMGIGDVLIASGDNEGAIKSLERAKKIVAVLFSPRAPAVQQIESRIGNLRKGKKP